MAEFEAEICFSALHQLLLPLFDGIEELRPLYRDALSVALGLGEGRPPDRLVVSGAALELVRRAGQERPLLIVLDDMFWVDRASADVLWFVSRRLAGSRVGLLAALRTPIEGCSLPQCRLEPLDWDAADRLVRARFPILGPDMRRRLLAEAAGNPLALLELPAALSGRRPFVSPGSAAVLPLSARLGELFASRVEELPPATRRLLLLAVLDNTGDLAALQRATGDAELADLGPAERSRLVHVDPETRRLVFRHPLTRSAVVELSTAQERREAHRALAGVRAEEPARQAWHLAEASVGPDERVAEMLEATARQMLGRGDPVGAVSALRRAAELSPAEVDRSRRLTESAFVGVNMAGRLGDSEELVAEALEAERGPGASLQAVTTAAFVLLNGDGDLDTVHRLLVSAIEARGEELDATDGDLAAAVYLLLLVCGFAGRAELWAPYFAILDRLRPAVPEDLLLASRTMPDPVRDAVGVLDRLEQVIAELGEESDSWHLRKVTLAAVFIDRLGGCRQALRRMVNSSREAGAWTLVVSSLNFMCLDYFLTGEWDELERLLAECFEICEHAGLQVYVPVLRYDRALLAAARGEDALARELADAITDWAEPRGAHLIAQFASHARGLAALGRGDFEAAYHHASAVSLARRVRPLRAPRVVGLHGSRRGRGPHRSSCRSGGPRRCDAASYAPTSPATLTAFTRYASAPSGSPDNMRAIPWHRAAVGVTMFAAASLRAASSASARICPGPWRHKMARTTAAQASAEGSSGRAVSRTASGCWTISAHRSASAGRPFPRRVARPTRRRPSGAPRCRPAHRATGTTAEGWRTGPAGRQPLTLHEAGHRVDVPGGDGVFQRFLGQLIRQHQPTARRRRTGTRSASRRSSSASSISRNR